MTAWGAQPIRFPALGLSMIASLGASGADARNDIRERAGNEIQGHGRMSRKSALTWVVILFIVSLFLRIPFLRRPLDGQHDWLTLHTLLTVSIWNQTGLQASHYALVMTWPNPADRFISYLDRATVEDTQGNTYFIAFPPFAFLLAFSVFKVLHLPPSAFGLKCINLALLIPASLCLYLMLERLFPKERASFGRWAAVLGTSLFLFDRSVLLSLGNLYFPLILIVPLWMISVFAYCSIQDGQRPRPVALAGFFALVFVMCYCDWLGFAAAGTFVLGAIFRKAAKRTNLWLAVLSTLAPLAAGTLTLFQYASIGGLRAFLGALASRFVDRAGLTSHSQAGYTIWSRHSYDRIVQLYVEQHAGLLLMIWGLACVWLLTERHLSDRAATGSGRRLILLFGLPVLADHLLLVNHTAIHNYANLKGTPLLTVIFVLLLGRVMRSGGTRDENLEPVGMPESSLLARASIVTAVACVISAGTYLQVRNDVHSQLSRLGNNIHYLAGYDQVVFLMRRFTGDFISPNLLYFAGRNVEMIDDEREAEVFLKEHKESRGIIFHATADGDVVSSQEVIRQVQ